MAGTALVKYAGRTYATSKAVRIPGTGGKVRGIAGYKLNHAAAKAAGTNYSARVSQSRATRKAGYGPAKLVNPGGLSHVAVYTTAYAVGSTRAYKKGMLANPNSAIRYNNKTKRSAAAGTRKGMKLGHAAAGP